MKSESLDEKDLAIIRSLSKDGKKTYTEIADKLDVSAQTISDRIEKLLKKGIIKRFTIEIAPEKIDYPIEFICELDINASVMDDVIDVLKKIPEIHVIKITTGIHDILCIGNVSSIDNLHEVVERKISTIPGVNKTYTSITLKKVKHNQVLNFDSE
ncbi:MAG: Lrp/AsnC family transcriptional regulator [Candidatus Hodarchaeales archaeon]|jgi:Lrp/AsnC family transcriptional regulator for asnA, asnC and gidA